MADVTGNQFVLCKSDELKEKGSGLRFLVKINNEIRPAFVLRFAGKPRAYLNECAHQAMELDLQEGLFFDRSGQYIICATHGALYSPDKGLCISGRCDGRSLTPVSVVETGKNICFVAGAGLEFISLANEPGN